MAMKKTVFIFLLLLGFTSACKKWMAQPDDCESYDYSNCVTTEPMLTSATLYFSINNEIQKVPFTIYLGKIEDNNVLFRDTAYNSRVYYDLNFTIYSVKAEYRLQGKTVYVVDGAEAEKWSNNICDSTCWGWDTLVFDLMLH